MSNYLEHTAHTMFCLATGDRFYMILKGRVDILVSNNSEQVKLASRVEGEAFGEIALLEDAPRTATVKAECLIPSYVKSLWPKPKH